MISTQIQPKLSLEDFLQCPETKPVREYINGKIYTKPIPKGQHSAIQTFLSAAINQAGIPQKLAGAFTELRCTFGGRSLVPNISVFAWERIPVDEQGEIENIITIVPDWKIEILSPEQSSTRVINNILFCLDRGTQLGWLIDPKERLVMSFFPQQQPKSYQADELLPSLEILPDFKVSVETIFNYLTFK
ncbi:MULTISPECIES: Uma2 family endonuclease [Spirulina sp. CCY15215]|uniref:Uma2 family endonuclease n=1 Tax=Spirulina sp. CCY15215 TaxID=2767591 RepID=UPI00194E3D7B|nr:Uma2 family endonuclease [Spirulina major]